MTAQTIVSWTGMSLYVTSAVDRLVRFIENPRGKGASTR
jgi:hypothetical protein